MGLKKKIQGDYWGNTAAVKKKIDTVGLPNLFHIMEPAENVNLATGVTRAAWTGP